MAQIKLSLTEQEARDLIRAASVHGRELAANPETRDQAGRLDGARFKLEREVDKKTGGGRGS